MSYKTIIKSLDNIQSWQEETYKFLHRNPELSMQETQTVTFIKEELVKLDYQVLEIGGGLVGILENGEGPTILFRADMDALPVQEETDLDYASEVDGVMHACGHDMHMTASLGAAWSLANNKEAWSGTYLALFQPGEEIAAGAKAMLEDGLLEKIPKPDIALAQHVLTTPEAGHLGTKEGPFLSTAASLKITINGRGAHGSMPNLSIDPIVIGSAIVSKLQTIVAREVDPFQFAVVTVGSFQSGNQANIIPETATLRLNIRAYDEIVKEQLISAIKRIAIAECEAGNCEKEPDIEVYDSFPLTDNDAEITEHVTNAFKDHFSADKVVNYKPMTASEDFSAIPRAFEIPYLYWGFGGFTADQSTYANHNPKFAPAIQPTLRTGTEAALVAILSYLGNK